MNFTERYHMPNPIQADVVVVGSGPGGASVARALAQAGRRVLILERGGDHRGRRYYGTYRGALRYTERGGLLYSDEGMQIVRPLMLGGATSMYCGCAAPPPTWLKDRYLVDLDPEVAETWSELGVAELAAELRGVASTTIAEAAQARGYSWKPQPKLMATQTIQQGSCSPNCMLGCRCGAKWNAASYIDQAVACGAALITHAHVTRILRDRQRAIGVTARIHGKEQTIYANTVVLAAGGVGTPRILQASGITAAGVGLTVDTTMLVYGVTPQSGVAADPPMTWAWHNPEAGYMLSTLIDPWLMYPIAIAPGNLANLRTWPDWRRVMGIMIKIKDEVSGAITPDHISKTATPADCERLAHAENIARQLLTDVGVKSSSLITSSLRGTHPGSTARIGTLVDTNLQTELIGLYICDASVFPEALARPTVITIIALGKRLARHLASA